MKHIRIVTFITLLALGTGCAWISPASETATVVESNLQAMYTRASWVKQ